MSRNGSYAKSMNGIVSFDDGDGTTIEGSTIETTNIICDTVNSNSINVDYISSYANGYVQCLQAVTFNGEVSTNTVPVNNSSLCNKLYVDTVATSGGTILPLDNVFTGTINTFNSKIKVSDITYDIDSITKTNTTDDVDLFNTTTGIITLGSTGQINLGSGIYVLGRNIVGATNTDPYEIFTNITSGRLDFLYNLSGTFNMNSAPTSAGTMNIANGSSSSTLINIGRGASSTVQLNLGITDVYGKLTCRGAFYADSITAKTNGATSFTIYDNCNTASNITLGSSDPTNLATTYISRNDGLCIIGSNDNRASAIRICDGDNCSSTINMMTGDNSSGIINILGNPNTISTLTSEINLGNRLTNINVGNFEDYEKTINIASVPRGIGVTTNNTINIGSDMSTINLGNGPSINIGGAASTINIGNALANTTSTITIGNTSGGTNNQQGNIIMGNADNSSNTVNNGRVTIRKLQVGPGSSYRCKIIGRNVGGGLGGIRTFTIPNAPNTYGDCIVFASINVSTTNMYIIMVNPLNGTQFSYCKRGWNGSGFFDATTESFNYVAYWI